MTTATKTTVATELAKLEQAREKAHAEVRKAKRKIDDWNAETEAKRGELTERQHSAPEEVEGVDKRVKPGTYAAKLSAEIRKRLAAENPHQGDHDAAVAEFHRHDEALTEFKRARVHDRLAQLDADHAAGAELIRSGFESLRRGAELIRVNVEEARAIVTDTPGLERGSEPHLAFDPRVNDWYALACGEQDTEIAKPGLTPVALEKLARRG